MSKPKWTDCTSYSRGESAKEPRSWEIMVGTLRLVVTTGHIYHPGKWVMHLPPWYDAAELKAATADEAKDHALAVARRKIEQCWKAVCSMTDAPSDAR